MQRDDFHEAASRCRRVYGVFRLLANRTDDALYHALAEVYSLHCRMRSDTVLRATFDQLQHLNIGHKHSNEMLFLVKYSLFPQTLEPGANHKPDLNKASRYAKLLNKARAYNVRPDAFVAFARQAGIQKTALASGPGKPRRSVKTITARRRARESAGSELMSASDILETAVSNLGSRFRNAEVAEALEHAVMRAKTQPQRLTLTIYVNDERAVVTGLSAQPWCGEFPIEAIRVQSSQPREPQASVSPKRPPTVPARSPLLSRPAVRRPVLPSSERWRRPADGLVWPSWR